MELLALKLLVTEDDVNALIARHLPADQPVRDVAVRLTPEGARVAGRYPTAFFNVRFETTWDVSVREGRVAARLADLNVAGVPAGMVRGILMDMLGTTAAREDGVSVEGETILVDPDRFLARAGLSGRANLTALRCGEGVVVLEGGTP